jgi:hypothetical protein
VITSPHAQGTTGWIADRIGIPTASNFDRIITKTGKPSSSAERYMARLAAEWFLGTTLDDFQSGFMERGSDMEARAVADYEFKHDVEAVACGLCLRDDGRVGASPDRLIGEDGLLEIKCPSAEVQMMYLIGGAPDDYFVQTQGQLWITGRKWVDLLCYHPSLPHVSRRYVPDAEFTAKMAGLIDDFVVRLDAAKALLADAKAERDAAIAERASVDRETANAEF